MADSTDINTSASSMSKSRKVRGATMLRRIEKARQSGIKIKVEFNPRTQACIGSEKKIGHFLRVMLDIWVVLNVVSW